MSYTTHRLRFPLRSRAISSWSSRIVLWQVLFSLWLTAACVFALPCISHAQAFNLLHGFSGPDDGISPVTGLIQANDGNFYGTTEYGGAYAGANGGPYAAVPYGYGAGTVFRITAGGTLATLYNFSGGTDGGYPPTLGTAAASTTLPVSLVHNHKSSCGMIAPSPLQGEGWGEGRNRRLHNISRVKALGGVAKGKTGSTSLSFPSSAGSSGTTVTMSVTSTFTGGSFTSSLNVKLP